MIKAKGNRMARRALGMPHWESNRFKIVLADTAAGGKWKVVKKKK
jgi:hypothetical protein